MNWYKFIFSDDKSTRLLRHTVFWLLWWIYFTGTYFHYQQTGLKQVGFEKWNMALLLKSIILLLLHIIACYSFINFLFTRYVLKARYLMFTAGVLVLCTALLLSCFYVHASVFPWIDRAFNNAPVLSAQSLWWASISASLLSAPKVIAAATATKLVKRWYRKEKEKERLQQEKLMADLKLLKAQIHPDFLFTSLDQIHSYAVKKDTVRASAYLLKLSELLSYTLYECDHQYTPLVQELKVITDYMALEKARIDNRLELDVSISGEAGNKTIAPLLLLPFIENSFSYCDDENLDTNWLNVDIQVKGDELILKLIHGKAVAPASSAVNGSIIANAKKRLDVFYPEAYELKTTVESEMMMTHLKIKLKEWTPERLSTADVQERESYGTV